MNCRFQGIEFCHYAQVAPPVALLDHQPAEDPGILLNVNQQFSIWSAEAVDQVFGLLVR